MFDVNAVEYKVTIHFCVCHISPLGDIWQRLTTTESNSVLDSASDHQGRQEILYLSPHYIYLKAAATFPIKILQIKNKKNYKLLKKNVYVLNIPTASTFFFLAGRALKIKYSVTFPSPLSSPTNHLKISQIFPMILWRGTTPGLRDDWTKQENNNCTWSC